MKKICFFNTTKAWGGGEKWHLETCKFMHAQGYSVLFITNKNSALFKNLEKTDIPHIGLNISNLSFINPISVNNLKKLFDKNDIGTIIINLSRDLKIAALAAKKAGVERVIYRRGSAIPIKNSFLNRYYFKHLVSDILANSEATKQTVLVNNPNLFPENKIKVIYNGININEFINKPYKPIYSKSENELVLTNLGRLENQKNQKFLIYLAEELKARHINFKLVIGGDGKLRESLETLTASLNLNNEIIFPGFIKNPKDLMYSGDIFLLSSLWEGFGYVLAEAALSKKPIVAFNISSNPEVVKNNETGFLTPLNDIKLFADKIEYLGKHPEILKDMGVSGFNFVTNTFDSKITQEKIKNYIINS